MQLKELGGWASDQIAQSYVDNSVLSKSKISNIISNQISFDQNQVDLPPRDHGTDDSTDNNVEPNRKRNYSVLQNGNEVRKEFDFISI